MLQITSTHFSSTINIWPDADNEIISISRMSQTSNPPKSGVFTCPLVTDK